MSTTVTANPAAPSLPPLQLPPSDALGIVQSDVIVRVGLLRALADLRAKPYLLDYAFAWLRQDPQSQSINSDRDVQQAKAWFLATNIRVVDRMHLNAAALPSVSLELTSSEEVENTDGDTHYSAREPIAETWPDLTPAFTPVSFDINTGVLVVPSAIVNNIDLDLGLVLYSLRSNRGYSIVDVLDPQTLVIAANVNDDFSRCSIRAPQPALVRHLESANWREGWDIGCHCAGEPIYCHYLYSLVLFALLRYRKTLLEARGYERTVLSGGPMTREPEFENELVYSRHISINGYVRCVWPTVFEPVVAATDFQLGIDGGGNFPADPQVQAPWTTPQQDSVIGDADAPGLQPPPDPIDPVAVIWPPDVGEPATDNLYPETNDNGLE